MFDEPSSWSGRRPSFEPLEPRLLLDALQPLDEAAAEASPGGIVQVELERGIDYEVPGAADDAFEYGVHILGTALTGARITTPWCESADLGDFLPADWNGQDELEIWRGPLGFEARAEGGLTHLFFGWEGISHAQWNSLDVGKTVLVVSYEGGSWIGTLDFSGVVQHDLEPNPSSPVQRTFEPADLTAQWPAWGSPPANACVWVELEDESYWRWGGSYYEEELPASATRWTVLAPLADGAYEFELCFADSVETSVAAVPVRTTAYTINHVFFLVGVPEDSLRVHPGTGHVYFLTPPGGWWRGQEAAGDFGGSLVTINDAAEEAWLRQQYGTEEWFWIGFNDMAAEGAWEWASGEPVTYTNWAPGQPDDWGGNEDAAVMNWDAATGGWNDVTDYYHYCGIAELPPGSTPDLTDDHGNSFSQATHVATPTSFTAALSYYGDLDFFSFDASVGQTYDILIDTPAGELDDSTVWLYDAEGRLLQSDDDGGHGWGSRLVWTAPADGLYYFAVDSYELGEGLGRYGVEITHSAAASDTPAAWFEHPAMWLDLQGGRGLAFSQPFYSGAASADQGAMLHALDLGDPLSPVEVGMYRVRELEDAGFAQDGPYYFADDSNTWAEPGPAHAELAVLERLDEGGLVEVNRIPFVERDVDAATVVGDYLYAGTQPEDESQAYLEIYSLADPWAPAFVGRSEVITGPPGSEMDPGITVSEGRAYVPHHGPGLVSILDVVDPYHPTMLGQVALTLPYEGAVMDMVVADGVLWAGVGWELQALDVSDPGSPQPLDTLQMEGRAGQIVIAFDGRRALVGCIGLGVQVLDISDPAAPQVLRSYAVNGAVGSVAVNNGYVYIPTGASRTAIFPAYVPGDANGDDVVDGLDYNQWSLHYLDQAVPAWSEGGWAYGNFNEDDIVDGLDYNAWSMKYGYGQAELAAGGSLPAETFAVTSSPAVKPAVVGSLAAAEAPTPSRGGAVVVASRALAPSPVPGPAPMVHASGHRPWNRLSAGEDSDDGPVLKTGLNLLQTPDLSPLPG